MHYQSHLLPLGEQRFLWVVCHGEHRVGGEDTRETSQIRFQVGHVGQPQTLVDIEALCVLPRPAAPAAARQGRLMAQMQGELARSGMYGSSGSMYADNEQRMLHAAALAERPALRVPRRVRTSRAGRLLLGFEPLLPGVGAEVLPGQLLLVDVGAGCQIGQWTSARAPLEPAGSGLERFSSVQIAAPLGLSVDGSQVLLRQGDTPNGLGVVLCAIDDGLSELARTPVAPPTRVHALTDGWLLVDHNQLTWLDAGLKPRTELALPRGTAGWNLAMSADAERLALAATTGAAFWVIERSGGKPRRFAPHRGARKDGWLDLAMSACGGWVASRWMDDLVLTRLADGVSWPLGRLSDAVVKEPSLGGYVVRSTVPAAFGFVGSSLLLGDEDQVRVASLIEPAGRAFVSEQGRAGARVPIRAKRGMGLEQLLQAAHLKEQEALLRPLHSPALCMKTRPLRKSGWLAPEDPAAPPLGSSRMGGWPDLPSGTHWPRWQGRPMAFLAQIDLAEVHALEPHLRLPSSGLLSFFVGCSEQTFEHKRRQHYLIDEMIGTSTHVPGWCVLHHPDVTALQRQSLQQAPLPQLFEPCSIVWVRGAMVLPDEHTAVYPGLVQAMTHTQCDDYNELIGLLQPDEDAPVQDQLLGYPRLIQGTPPELMCELSTRGQDPWKIPDHADPDHAGVYQSAAEWALLLQLTSNPHAGFNWGDGGHFYFYGNREAMQRGDFSSVWVNYET